MKKRLADYAVWLAIFLCGGLLACMLSYPALAAPVCADKAAIYELALTDKDDPSKGMSLWKDLVARGDCAYVDLPAQYFRTLTIYQGVEETRVVEWLMGGEILYGLLIGPPPGVTLVGRRQ